MGIAQIHGKMGKSNLVPGIIVMWSGAANAIPTGWALCDGTNGTPDLRGRFVVGAGDAYTVGDTGGEAAVTLTTSQIPAHTHSINLYEDDTRGAGVAGGYYNSWSSVGKTMSAGGGQSHENRPPYYALCYIMLL